MTRSSFKGMEVLDGQQLDPGHTLTFLMQYICTKKK